MLIERKFRKMLGQRGMLAIALLAALGGCASKIVYGTLPDTDALKSLQVGKSRGDEVKSVLGEPRGKGMVHFGEVEAMRNLWSYEYTEVEGQAIRLKMLLVFMDGDTFDGYLWFSAEELLQKSQEQR